MGRHTTRKIQCAFARAAAERLRRLRTPRSEIDSRKFVYSILVEGSSIQDARRLMLHNGIIPPSPRSCYRAEADLLGDIKEFCLQKIEAARAAMQPGTILAVDGSWDHRTYGRNCVVAFIDTKTNQIVDVEIVTRTTKRTNGNYIGSPQGMEAEGVLRMATRWMSDEYEEARNKVVGYVHDQDSSSAKKILEAGWELTEYFDLNHCMRSFNTLFNKYNISDCLKPVEVSLRKFFYTIVKSHFPPEEKKVRWLSAKLHHTGDHSKCKDPNHQSSVKWEPTPDTIDNLSRFLVDTEYIFEKVHIEYRTQASESFNAVKAKYTDKRISWGSSYATRILLAAVQFNSTDSSRWKRELRSFLEIDNNSDAADNVLIGEARMEEKRLFQRRAAEYQKAEREKRIYERFSTESEIGATDYNMDKKNYPSCEEFAQFQNITKKVSQPKKPPTRVKKVKKVFKKNDPISYIDTAVAKGTTDYQLNDEIFNKRRGIPNPGLQCFIISAVQALGSCDEFVNIIFQHLPECDLALLLRYIRQDLDVEIDEAFMSGELQKYDEKGNPIPIQKEHPIIQFPVELISQQQTREKIISLSECFRHVTTQEDVFEFIEFCFSATKEHLPTETGVLIDAMSYFYVTTTTCCNTCGLVSAKSSYTTVIPLPLDEKGNSIKNMLQRYESENEMTDKDAKLCEKCNRLGPHTMYSHIEKYPNVAMFQFPRYRFVKVSDTETKIIKNGKSISLPYNLILDGARYTLACTIHHTGSYDSGHYYVVIATNGGYVKINNEIITGVERYSPTTVSGCLYIRREE